MRDIKFRVWRVERQEFASNNIYASWLQYDNGIMIPSFQEEIILMQFTGMKDIDGREIYEGDIYRDEFSIDDEKGIDERVYFICVFVKCMAAFCWLSTAEYLLGMHDYDKWIENEELPYTLDVEEVCKLKVIGNAYENPELLTA